MCGACVKDDRKMIVFHFISYLFLFFSIYQLFDEEGWS